MNSLSRPSRDDVARGRRDGSGFGGKILCFQSFVEAIGRQVAEAWCAKRVCVLCGKSQRGDRRRRGESGSRMRGQPKKNSALNSHFAKGRWERIEGREACEAFSCLDMRRWRVSCRPQGAFVAGGARRRRLSWSRPPAAWRWRFARTRNGAGRRSRKPACAGHESVRAARRDTKTLRPSLEFSTGRGEGYMTTNFMD